MSSPRFPTSELVDDLMDALAGREAELRLEQAVHGLDREKEPAIQTLLADGLRRRYEVAREVYYPSSSGSRAARLRCDLVLTPKGCTLDVGEAPLLFDAPRCPPEDALWLEIKLAQQLREGGRSNPRYAQQWRRAIIADLQKLRDDARVRSAALAFVVFTDSATTFEKDVRAFEQILDEESLLAGFRRQRSVPIVDRIGHTLCSIALWPVVS